MKAIIIDDERSSAENLSFLIADINLDIAEVSVYTDIREGIEAVRSARPDLVFLDIEMPHMNGLSAAKILRDFCKGVIFTTAHQEHAVKAFRLEAVDYLLKPVHPDHLREAVERVRDSMSFSRKLLERLERLENTSTSNTPTRLAIPSLQGVHFLNIIDIVRLEASSNYTDIYLKDRSRITSSKVLKDFEILLNPNGFIRVHNSHLVNPQHIVKYLKMEGGHIEMCDGSQVEISRRRKAEVEKGLFGKG